MTKIITRRTFSTSVLTSASLCFLATKARAFTAPENSTNGAKTMAKTALLLIDVQNDYFPGGKFPLPNMPKAGEACAKLLAAFRAKKLAIFHVRHENATMEDTFFQPHSKGAQIHASVAPAPGEPVVVKQFPNAFRETNLKKLLDAEKIENLVIVGAMSNMCVDASVRAAVDFGYVCTVAHNACAAMNIEFNNRKVPSLDVHTAFMGALAFGYAKVTTSDALISAL